jgi:hypothetical protein
MTSKDPCEALQKIRERWPKLGTEGLFRVFEATVIDDRELHQVIIARAFTAALQVISEHEPGAPRA